MPWTPKPSWWKKNSPQNKKWRTVLLPFDEIDSEGEIPKMSFEDCLSVSFETECAKKIVPKDGKFKTKTQKRKNEAQRGSKAETKKVTTGATQTGLTHEHKHSVRSGWWSRASSTHLGER